MWRTTWRSLLAHKLRLAFSGLAIVLGVAFVSGTMIFTDTLNRTFTALFESTAADVSVQPAAAFDAGVTGPGGGVQHLPAGLVEDIRAVDGVAAAHRRLTAEVAANGDAGHPGVAAWSAARDAQIDRIRGQVDAIVASGLTLSKLTVAASLLNDLARA